MSEHPYLSTEDDKTWHISLDRYERDNLLALLNAVGYGAKAIHPLNVFNNGDWVGQVALKLQRLDGSYTIDERDRPNVALREIKRRLGEYDDAKRLYSEIMLCVHRELSRRRDREEEN